MKLEPSSNLVYTCKEHGKETYFKIKKQERLKDFKDLVYVWFKENNVSEKMWVRVRSGTQRRGFGTIANEPVHLKNWKHMDTLFFETGRDKVTRPIEKMGEAH